MISSVEAHLWQAAFPTFGGSMGVRPLEAGEQYWYEEIRDHFMYPVAGAFANPPTSTEGVLHNLGIDPEEKKKKSKKKKIITIDAEVTSKKGGSSRATTGAADKGTLRFRQSNLEDYVITSDSLEGLSHIGEKKTGAAGSKSSGSAGSRNPDAGATPSSIALDEEEEEEEEEPVEKLVSRKRSREETTTGTSIAQKAGGIPLIGKQSNLRSLYKFSPVSVEAKKKTREKKGVVFKDPQEPTLKKTKVIIKPFKTTRVESEKEKEKVAEKPVDKVVEKEKEREKKKASEKPTGDAKETGAAATTAHEKTQSPEVVHVTGLDQPSYEKRKEPEFEKLTKPAQADAPIRTIQVTSTTGGSGSAIHKEKTAAAGGVSSGGAGGSIPQSSIGPTDTVGDIYYKTYTEEARDNAPHRAPWGLKQKDTFLEVNRQRAQTHDALYHAYVVGEANTHAANHQIVREWRTMVRERAEWEKYHERLLKQVKEYEKAKAAIAEEKAKFEADKKSEEWGREGLRGKLRTAEDLLAKERAEWKKICEKNNPRMYAARSKITDLEAQVTELKGKVEDVQSDREHVEAELKAQVSSKDKDLAAKDVEIAELKCRLQEQTDKSESLEIDLEAKRVKAATAEEAKQKAKEARDISTSALNVAQNNYSEAQGVVDTLVAEAEWMRGRGVVLMANSILNAGELDGAVASLIDPSRAILDPPETVELSDEEPAKNDGDGDGDGDGNGDKHDDGDGGDGYE
ncbi:uncharacterized protein LOC110910556 [Helianthus annuus]|uniref:uncharacterized protein LOC110910556 n=1 Tax=Helianthus annuus TaxID=4232 RepID=UPI000B8F99C9|nr:uncharacterized protein LOC110910556 [Helianthus annuus]